LSGSRAAGSSSGRPWRIASAVSAGQRVVIVDDLLATGGTARATADLVEGLGGRVHAFAFLIELVGLNGRAKLGEHDVHSVLKY
jgi:adenine phosphoribosyltransferase